MAKNNTSNIQAIDRRFTELKEENQNLKAENTSLSASITEKRGSGIFKWTAIAIIGGIFAFRLPPQFPGIAAALAGKETKIDLGINAIPAWLTTGLGASIALNIGFIIILMYLHRRHREQFATEHDHTIRLQEIIDKTRSGSGMPRLGHTRQEDES